MREIKFKAWDSKKKKFINPYELVIRIADGVVLNTNDIVLTYIYLMQYTGLDDIDGKEVYERDILELGKFRGQVEFRNGSYWINWTDNTSTKLFHQVQGSKVIGNICEHKHLLENK